MGEKKGNSRIVWVILFAIVTVILCYLFTVVYFYFISPYNIAVRIGVWPFVSDSSIGEMYSDATVQINYEAVDENFEKIDVSVAGVNVRKDGYIIAPYSEFSNYSQEALITIFTNSGTAYKGKLLYADINYNLAIFKCLNMDGSNKKIKIPFAAIGAVKNYDVGEEVIMLSVGANNKAIVSGSIKDNGYIECVSKKVDGCDVLDFTVSYGFITETDDGTSFNGGVVFDKNGNLLGFSFGKLLEANLLPTEYFIQPAYGAKYLLKDVANAYKADETYVHPLISALYGCDSLEAEYMVNHEQGEYGSKTFYFDNGWNPVDSHMEDFSLSGDTGFFLLRDFVYRDNTISANSIIRSVTVSGTRFFVEYKCDLIDAFYKLDEGDKIVISYLDENAVQKSITFTF